MPHAYRSSAHPCLLAWSYRLAHKGASVPSSPQHQLSGALRTINPHYQPKSRRPLADHGSQIIPLPARAVRYSASRRAFLVLYQQMIAPRKDRQS